MTPFDEAPKLATFTLRGHNPDVLNTIANLSNDEVFTPPELANEMLDMLEKAWAEGNNGAHIWADHTVTFLDPFTKSGVFLREITARLVKGLEEWMPDLQQRVNHILTKQVFGIGITQLTSLLARRSVYCSKNATGKHSIVKSFDRDWGNIWFERTEHTWVGGTDKVLTTDENGNTVLKATNGRCKYCGASQKEYERSDALETHAYAFIHADDIKARIAELFGENMHFDVIIGNPPYQLGSDGGTRDLPIYQHFVEQAKKLEPRYLSMIIQSRWMTSGLGLSHFRDTMLHDKSIKLLVDYPNSDEVFPGTGFRGGVCYFLRDSLHNGSCEVTTVRNGVRNGPVARELSEFDVFVRDVRAVSILKKVLNVEEPSITTILSADKEFGWTSNFRDFHTTPQDDEIPIYYVDKRDRKVGSIPRTAVGKSAHLIDTWKVMVPKAGSGGDTVPDYVLGKTLIAPSPSVCTQTFLFFHLVSEEAAVSLESYLKTRFARFLISLRKITQDATKSTYTWVPIQEWDRSWQDEALYKKYDISKDEIDYIESMIRLMGSEDE